MADPVILITADDDHLLLREYEDVLSELRSEFPDADIGVHLAPDLDHLPDLRTSSLFGGPTIVVIRALESIGKASDLTDQILDYVTAPDPEAVLVLASRGTQKLGRKIPDLVKEHGRVVQVKVPLPWDERGWRELVAGEFRRLRRRADPSAVEAVLTRAGTSAAVIASHVSQICLAHPSADTITEVEVADVVKGAGNMGSFVLAEACLDERDPARTVELVRGALQAGESPLAMLGLLNNKVRELMVARAGLDVAEAKRRPDRGNSAPGRMSPGQVKRLENSSRQWAVGELQWCHDRLAEADIALKGNSELPDDVVMEMALLDIATRREPGAPWNPQVSLRG